MSYEFRLWLSVIAVTRFALTLALSQRERGQNAPNSKRLIILPYQCSRTGLCFFRLRLCFGISKIWYNGRNYSFAELRP